MITEEEYKKMLFALREEYDRRETELMERVARENSPYEVGDIVTDHIGMGRILGETRLVWDGYLPTMSYLCENLTQSGKVSRREPKRWISQRNIKARR